MLKLTEFLLACKVPLNLASYKIHLATGYPNPPLEAFFAGKFKEWQEYQTRGNFPCEMVIGLIELSKNRWLFAGVFRVLGCVKNSAKHVAYETELLPGQDDLIGRVVVEHAREGRRASYLIGKPDGGAFVISELREKKLSIEEFPGFNSVCVGFATLKIIIEQQIQSWYGALSNIKGVYLIADTKAGKVYVGSATGDSGIWQRWSSYVAVGHGGNKELRNLLKDKSRDYWSNFQYSILEIADSHASDGYILKRESYWKDALMSRTFGYNTN
jgi:hypothetical protein